MHRALLLAGVGALFLVSHLPVGAPLPEHPTVVAIGFQYIPAVLVVPLGTPVTFTSLANLHTWTTANSVTAANVANGNDLSDTNCVVDGEPGEDANPDTCDRELMDGASFTHVFQTAGTFAYFCQFHTVQKMVGVVRVV